MFFSSPALCFSVKTVDLYSTPSWSIIWTLALGFLLLYCICAVLWFYLLFYTWIKLSFCGSGGRSFLQVLEIHRHLRPSQAFDNVCYRGRYTVRISIPRKHSQQIVYSSSCPWIDLLSALPRLKRINRQTASLSPLISAVPFLFFCPFSAVKMFFFCLQFF